MCTTGVLRLDREEYLLFKNKDFGRAHFDDRLVVEPDVFGVEGITTWAGDDPDLDEFSGFSVGANRYGLLACDSNVQTEDGYENYDVGVEIALRRGHDVDSAVIALRDAAENRPFMRGNIVLIDGTKTAAVELRYGDVHAATGANRMARTNHHLEFGATGADEDRVSTGHRLRSALRRLAGASTIDDVFALQRTHDDGPTGICNHGVHDTVYSYVLHRHAAGITLHVAQGRPCESPPRHVLDLPLGDRWDADEAESFRAAYPSARAAVTAAG